MTTAIILAGGLGTRLRSVIPDLPKPMAPICGRPFIEYQLEYWIKQGINKFILSVGYKNKVISGYFGDNYKGVEIDYVIENEPLGTGGAFLLASERIANNESFLLLNGDTYFDVDLDKLKEFAIEKDADWCFSLFKTNDTERYMGMEVSDESQITSLVSGTSFLANGGVYWVNPRILNNKLFSVGDKSSLENDFFPKVLALKNRLYGIEFLGRFIDIGIPTDYEYAQKIFTYY
mgnify:CR=1 FL=1